MEPTADRQQAMVENQLVGRGIADRAVLEAMRRVPRTEFVGAELNEFAYEDSPLPIDEGQTISQPYMVALMAQALELKEDDRVLEVGTGSGYAAAVLSRIASEVFTVERLQGLAHSSAKRFVEFHYDNIHVLHGDGTLGWPEHGPYDAIVVAAGGPEIPPPLLEQLKIGGRLVIPTGETKKSQTLLRVRRTGESKFEQEDLGAVRFVPLIGAQGWEGVERDREFSRKPSSPDSTRRRR